VSRVAVLGGGASCEHEVSLRSAASVADGLRTAGHEVVEVTIGRDGSWPGGLAGSVRVLQGCDVVFPAVHGPRGEDGTLAALLDLAGTPYVGCGVGAGALAMDKWVTKLVARSVGVPVAAGLVLAPGESFGWPGHPVVVKPVAAGSSHGVALARTSDELHAAVAAAFELDDRVLVEEVLDGREVDVAVLVRPTGEVLSPALEIRVDGIFGHDDKYGGPAPFVVPAPLTADELVGLEEAASRMVRALRCRGVVRVDFFLTADGWVLNEVNTMPGFTATSQVPLMFEAAGLSYPELLDLLVSDAVCFDGRDRTREEITA
jgi:D-alanine-D-alanine ligase